MQKDLILKIDALIEMSKSTSNIDTLKAELIEINDEIETKKRDLEDQKTSMQDEKYIKASDRIIDENIKVSLELKIRKLENSRKELEKDLEEALKKEDETHTHLNALQDKIAKLNSLIETLKEKIASLSESDSESKNYFNSLVTENEKKRNKADVELKMVEEEYRKSVENLTTLTEKLEELKKKIETEKEKLKDTETSLATNSSYIDNDLKKEDEKRLRELENRLNELEKRKEEIETDPVSIGNEAKELLLEDDRMGCFLKVKELVNQLKKDPFMDIPSIAELTSVLNSSEERAMIERDEFAASLESKKYDGNDTPILQEREKYLNQQKNELEKELNELKNKIKKIDTIEVREISSLLSSANIVSEKLRKEIVEYASVMEESIANATPRKKAILNSAYNKKEEELKTIGEVITAYEMEMQTLMKESKRIAEEDIEAIHSKINNIDNYLKEIHKKTMIGSKSKDVLAVENDKAKLKELTDQVKEISLLKKLKQTPSEIYDEIEMMLGSFIEEEEPEKITEEEPAAMMNNFRITEDFEDASNAFNRSEKNKDVLKEKEVEEMKTSVDLNFEIPWQEPMKEENIDLKQEAQMEIPEEHFAPVVNNEEIKEPLEYVPPIIEVAPEIEISPLDPKELNEDNDIEKELVKEVEEIKEIEEPAPFMIDEMVPLDTPVKERFKVISVEELNEEDNTPKENKEPVSQEDVMITDFKDEDYIDFNTLLDGGNV